MLRGQEVAFSYYDPLADPEYRVGVRLPGGKVFSFTEDGRARTHMAPELFLVVEPKLGPLGPSDIVLGKTLIREGRAFHPYFVTFANDEGVQFVNHNAAFGHICFRDLRSREISFDNGSTWQKAEKEIAE